MDTGSPMWGGGGGGGTETFMCSLLLVSSLIFCIPVSKKQWRQKPPLLPLAHPLRGSSDGHALHQCAQLPPPPMPSTGSPIILVTHPGDAAAEVHGLPRVPVAGIPSRATPGSLTLLFSLRLSFSTPE